MNGRTNEEQEDEQEHTEGVGGKNVWMKKRVSKQMHDKWLNGYIGNEHPHELMNKYMNEWMKERTNDRANEWTNEKWMKWIKWIEGMNEMNEMNEINEMNEKWKNERMKWMNEWMNE